MKSGVRKILLNGLGVLFMLTIIISCANIGNPNGGPYDEEPPRFIGSTPPPNQTQYHGKKVEIFFDELIQLDNPTENVIITPPQKELPIVRSQGRKVVVELLDTLKPDMTYTIDFGSSIADNNEKNAFENFSFAFSTGEVIDSLEVSGYVLDALSLEPLKGITVGLHENLADSAFQTLPFLRTSRTNERGKFIIRNIKEGSYRLFAINDLNRDYRFDQPGEAIAFNDSIITPTFEFTTRQDTVWKDTLTIDTILTVPYTRFMPDDLTLRLFKESFTRQYMLRPIRENQHSFQLSFNAPLEELPEPIPLNFEPMDSIWYVVERPAKDSTFVFWITDSLIWQQDTLQFTVDYQATDSLNMFYPRTDTINAVYRKPPEAKKKKKNEPDPINFLGINSNASSSMDVYDTIKITLQEPSFNITKELFTLEQKADTLWNPVEFTLMADTLNPMMYYLHKPLRYGEEYRLSIDSAAIYSVYGHWNNAVQENIKIKNRDQYGFLFIETIGCETKAYVELLNKSGVPIRRADVKDGGALFNNLNPDKYYARIIIDRNENGKWDTGIYISGIQPEEVFYCPVAFEVTMNWESEERWNIRELPLFRQKPLDITRNKPKEITKQKRDYKNEGRNTSSSSNPFGSNLRF